MEPRTAIEVELTESLKELKDLKFALDQSTIVAITDQRGIITYVNDAFCRISKYSREELLGQDHRIINSNYHPKEFIRNLWTTIAGGEVWKGEIRNRAKDGSIYWVDTTIVPFLDEHHKPHHYVAIRHDITQQKNAEDEIRQQTAELNHAAYLSFVGELAAGMAHEVKNPLAGIQGTADILIRRRDANDPEREALEGIRHEVERIDATVRALLDRARPRALSPAETSLTELTMTAVTVARSQAIGAVALGRRIQVEFEAPAEDLVVHADAAQIEDAVLNLIINAIEAIEEEGRITVRIRQEETEDRGEEAIIEVTDTGHGISEENLSRIFNMFFTTTKGGTGLGLPAVRRIARAHGGRGEASSTGSVGLAFRIHLPLGEDAR